MAFETQEGVVASHAVSVVADPDEAFASAANFDANSGGLGVNRIFHKLLENGRGPFNHLAGCDLVGHLVRQDTDTINNP